MDAIDVVASRFDTRTAVGFDLREHELVRFRDAPIVGLHGHNAGRHARVDRCITLPGMPRPTSIDDYLASVPDAQRQALQKLRAQIRSVVPDCEECISYSMPAFRWRGEVFAGFAATKVGCSYYPFSGTTLATLSDALAPYSRTKSAVHFDPKKGLPLTLLKKLIAARKAEIER